MVCLNYTKIFYEAFQNTNFHFNLVGHEFELYVCILRSPRAKDKQPKINVAMNSWMSQASYPRGNFSDTSRIKLLKPKGLRGHGLPVCILTENKNQVRFYPFFLHEISVLVEITLGHLCYSLTYVPTQTKYPPVGVYCVPESTCYITYRTG